ncbi:hypothetical protein GO755_39710 [Spirosoma sp. HMF4905]|uniref:Uncharacterized protein n=1 Tax=Spirosoma arboris TaxID=2682092 RepID=A0A7K1SQX1_9BACT|nr:hypothetical protein [Spirosoma arboris]MVM36204.1 hypothetical protein [Spirosoma arboris]
MHHLETFSDSIPYERLLIEALGFQSPEGQNALAKFTNLLYVEQGKTLSQTSLPKALLPVKDNLMLALDTLSQKPAFTQFSTHLSRWISQVSKAQSSTDLTPIIRETVDMLFPLNDSDAKG